MNVLVCDDDRSTRFVVGRILTQQFGLVVTACADGLEALQVLARAAEDDGTGVRMWQASPAMVVDGDPEVLRMLAGELRRYGTVVEADSGASAVASLRGERRDRGSESR